MATTGAAKAKAKAKHTPVSPPHTPAAPPVVIDVEDGAPHEETTYVGLGGTVQFDNRDAKDYRIRLGPDGHDKNPPIDVLLPAVGSVTLMADPLAKGDDCCEYDLLPTDLKHPTKHNKSAAAGGGKIIIGPTPAPSGKN